MTSRYGTVCGYCHSDYLLGVTIDHTYMTRERIIPISWRFFIPTYIKWKGEFHLICFTFFPFLAFLFSSSNCFLTSNSRPSFIDSLAIFHRLTPIQYSCIGNTSLRNILSCEIPRKENNSHIFADPKPEANVSKVKFKLRL